MPGGRTHLHVPRIIVAVAAVAALYAWAIVALTPSHPGSIGMNMNALGTDFMVFYSGPRWFFDGNLGGLFDGERFTAYLNHTFAQWLTEPTPFRPWVYPPNYLLAMLPLAALPFAWAYAAFEAATAALLAAALSIGIRPKARGWLMAAAAVLGPAAALNVGIGQNAFLTSALIVGGFRLLATGPALGGAVLGLLTIKPQFWMLVPVALVALRQWRALAFSVLTAALVALASIAVFGIEAWQHWIALARNTYGDAQGRWVELGRMWGDSVYACVASAGLPEPVANAAQAAATLAAIALVWAAFRRELSWERRIAILLAATILGSPHSSLSDSVLLGTAAALLAGEMALRRATLAHWTLALALWIAPLVNPPIVSPVGRLTPLLILGFVALAFGGRAEAGMRHAVPALAEE